MDTIFEWRMKFFINTRPDIDRSRCCQISARRDRRASLYETSYKYNSDQSYPDLNYIR